MTQNNYFAQVRVWAARATVLASLAIALAACDQNTSNNPNGAGTQSPQAAKNSTNVTPSPKPQSSPAAKAVPSEPITDLKILSQTTDKQSLAEKRAQLANLQVKNVVGDRTFWVASSNNQQLFVLLAPPLDEGSAEQKIVVKTGQTVQLKGVLKKMPTIAQAKQQWGLDATEAENLKNQALYLLTEQIEFK